MRVAKDPMAAGRVATGWAAAATRERQGLEEAMGRPAGSSVMEGTMMPGMEAVGWGVTARAGLEDGCGGLGGGEGRGGLGETGGCGDGGGGELGGGGLGMLGGSGLGGEGEGNAELSRGCSGGGGMAKSLVVRSDAGGGGGGAVTGGAGLGG